jgi:putative ABC transport system permease protein
MKIQLFKLFLNENRKRKKKTALITFAIAWGTLSLLLMMSFGRGLSEQFRIAFKGLGIDLVMFTGGRTSKDYQGLPKGRRIRLYAGDVDLLKRQIPEIKRICAESYVNVTLTHEGKYLNRTAHGVSAPFMDMRTMYPQKGGRFINPDDQRYSRRVVFLGWNIAGDLFGKENPVGKKIIINRIPFTIVGVMKKKLQNSNYNGLDYNHVFIPLSTLAQVHSQRFVDRIHVQPTERKYSLLVERKVKNILGKKYRFDPEDDYAFGTWNTIEDGNTSEKIFMGIELFLAGMGGLTLLIAAVGVTNLMYATVKERTREIGVKMALGAKRRHIVTQFMMEAFLIFLKGTFWGGLIAYNIVSAVRLLPFGYDMTSAQSYLMRPEFSLDILLMFISVMGTLVFLSGIFPAIRASRLNPTEALRYQ